MKKTGVFAKFCVFSIALCAIPFASESFQQKVAATVPRYVEPMFTQRKVAQIKDAGELFSNLDIQKNQLMMWQLRKQFLPNEVNYIVRHCNETQWISCLNSMAKRVQLAQIIKMYKTFQIGKLSEGDAQYTILLIPAYENREMAEEMRPKEDMVFIINARGAALLTR